MSELDTAKTILGAQMRLRNSTNTANAKGREIMRSGEQEAQTIADGLRAHAGRGNSSGPTLPEDVDHGEYR